MRFDDEIQPVSPVAPVRPLRAVRVPGSVRQLLLKGERARLSAIRRRKARRPASDGIEPESAPALERSIGEDQLEETVLAYEQAALRLGRRPPSSP